MRTALALLAGALLLALAPAPAAGEPRLDPRSQAAVQVAATADPAQLAYRIGFSLAEPREAYLKVSPAPGNPVFGNGTPGGPGWWTEVALDGPAGRVFEGRTVGDPPLEFGRLDANASYNLTVVVHAPAGALAEPGPRAFEYVLAERSDPAEGSGGVLDESAGLHLTAEVAGDPPEEARAPDRASAWMWAVGIALVAGGGVLAWVALRRR